MPWTAKSFASKHNKKLSGHAAASAAKQASAMVREGVDEGIAIATANKRANKMNRKPAAYSRSRFMGKISSRSAEKHNLVTGHSALDRAERGET